MSASRHEGMGHREKREHQGEHALHFDLGEEREKRETYAGQDDGETY